MSGIVALGRKAGPFLDDPVHVVHIEPDAVLADLATMHAMIDEQLKLQEPVVVIYSRDLGVAVEKSLRIVRASMNGAPILWHRTTLPPLATDVLVTLAGALNRPLGGVSNVAAALPMIERQLIHVTWLNSVSGLRDPAPSVMQHAKSALPNTSWLVSSYPEPAIHKLETSAPVTVPRSSQEVGVAMADLDGNRTWIEPMISSQLRNAVGVEVAPPADTVDYWGCKRVTQVVLYPRSIEWFAEGVSSRLDPGTCRWCRRTVGSTICPWCELPRSGLTKQSETNEDAAGDVLLDGAPPDATRRPPAQATEEVAPG